jgi:MFS family permease
LQIPAQDVKLYYSFVCLTAPVAGVVLSGVIYTSIGGYHSVRAYCLTALLGIFACVMCLPVPFIMSKHVTYFLLWLVFFFGASILAPTVAIMLNSVEPERRTAANSLATMCYNLLGYLPAPFIYGLVVDQYKDDPAKGNTAAIGVNLYWSIFAIIFSNTALFIFLRRETREKKCTVRQLLANEKT